MLLKGVLVVLDARPGGIIYRDIIPEYANYARTIYEGLKFTLLIVDFDYPFCAFLKVLICISKMIHVSLFSGQSILERQ